MVDYPGNGLLTKYEFSEHARDMLKERGIKETWVKTVIEESEKKVFMEDGTVHYIRSIEQHGGRYLRVVVNPHVIPQRVVTVFFDRRIGRSV